MLRLIISVGGTLEAASHAPFTLEASELGRHEAVALEGREEFT